jgi:gentisate 1,2-dioxygenase
MCLRSNVRPKRHKSSTSSSPLPLRNVHLRQHLDLYIDGEFCAASDGGTLEASNPATGEVWATCSVATEDDVNRVVDAANRALFTGTWAEMNATQRGKML